MKRLVYWVLRMWWPISIAAIAAIPASARAGIAPGGITPLAELAQPGSPLRLDIQTGVSAQATVQEIAATADAAFQTFDPLKIYDSNKHGVLWLRFRVLADEKTGDASWTVSLPKPYVDDVAFFHQDTQGLWQGQFSGTDTAHQRWPVRALYPQFRLPPMTPGVHTFYLRVQSALSLHVSVNLQPTESADATATSQLIQAVFLLGLMVFAAVLSLILTGVYKQRVYAWYALFVLANFFAISGYIGTSNYFFWPETSAWHKYFTFGPSMLAALIQLHFSRLLFVNQSRDIRLNQLVNIVLIVNLVLTVHALLTPNIQIRILESIWVVSSSVLLNLYMVLRAWWAGAPMAPVWILGCTPLIVALALTFVEHFGIRPVHELPYLSPLYGIACEIPILLLILLWHAKNHLTHTVRESALASADPLKGYLQPAVFTETANHLWNDARRQSKDLGIAYVKVIRDKELAALVNTYDPVRERAQWVRILRTVMREGDTLAQMDDEVFALFFKGQSRGDDFSSRLSRLVALGLRAPQDYGAPEPLQFRVVASTRGSATGGAAADGLGTWAALDNAMRARLASETGWARRSIRFLGAVPVAAPLPEENISDAWTRALAAQTADDGKPKSRK